jgi:norsolorinic acid ketoreductase
LGQFSGGSRYPYSTDISAGIGKALTKAYLSLSKHTVIATLRTTQGPQADELRALPVAPGTQLLLVAIENTSSTDPNTAIARLTSADGGGITHIDTVIANSGISMGGGPLESVDPKNLTKSFDTNAVSNLTLFAAANFLLQRSSRPKWIAISTRVASIAAPLPFYPYAAAYGMSKAAQNWFTQ